MAACYRCGAEIPVFEEGLPVCEACSEVLSRKTVPRLNVPNVRRVNRSEEESGCLTNVDNGLSLKAKILQRKRKSFKPKRETTVPKSMRRKAAIKPR